MATVEGLKIVENMYNYAIVHKNKKFVVCFPKTNVVYGNAPFIGDISVRLGLEEVGKISWYGVKHVLDQNYEGFESEVKTRHITKTDMDEIVSSIKSYETNYKTRNLPIGMYNDWERIAKAVHLLATRF